MNFAMGNSSEWDLQILNGQFKMIEGENEVSQRIKNHILSLRGELFMNEQFGVAYLEILSGKKKGMVQSLKLQLRNIIQSTRGVRSISSMEMGMIDRDKLAVVFAVRGDNDALIEDAVGIS
ncbi:hypothetical protein [Treponema sp. R6D11]